MVRLPSGYPTGGEILDARRIGAPENGHDTTTNRARTT